MAAASDALLVELPVVTGALLAGIGWLIRQGRLNAEKLRAQIRELEQHMTRSTVEDAVQARQVAENTRAIPQIRENQAVTASELENHLRWHERHGG